MGGVLHAVVLPRGDVAGSLMRGTDCGVRRFVPGGAAGPTRLRVWQNHWRRGASLAFAPDFTPISTSRVSIGEVIDKSEPLKRSDVPADFSPAAELRAQLENRLTAKGLAAT